MVGTTGAAWLCPTFPTVQWRSLGVFSVSASTVIANTRLSAAVTKLSPVPRTGLNANTESKMPQGHMAKEVDTMKR